MFRQHTRVQIQQPEDGLLELRYFETPSANCYLGWKLAADEARSRAKEILEKAIKKDADFAQAAGEYSDGPTKDKGGDLGKFGKGIMDKAFEEAASKLKKGQVSGVVDTPFRISHHQADQIISVPKRSQTGQRKHQNWI